MRRQVVITGGGRGIGASISRALVQAGFTVRIVGHRSVTAGAALCEMLDAQYGEGSARWLGCDLGDALDVEHLCRSLEEDEFYGLVHCAGISQDSLAAVADLEAARRMMQINFWTFVQLYQALVRPMSMRRAGRILCIGSVAADFGMKGNALYASSKAALRGFVRSSMTEVASRAITINCIEPGFIDTALLDRYADQRRAIDRRIPAGRFGSPEEVAGLAAFLFSEAGGYINGQHLTVDGGLSRSMAG
ncbi:SDR family oxidoreductase [Pseudomonas poae]|uniref:SDR family oxidoreductase n=1 Tax=Pseudomonas poae TaxID=200451 RepID=UPI001475BC63|nr:SDR family NAD(P)-dependent oxidoreductase [Pseudomonas poae]NMZ50383.1 SDR family oxidoreductase [Pseudomonas poae]